MTTTEALKKMQSATVAQVMVSPEMVFGYGPDDALEMVHSAISCIFVGPHFTVVSTAYAFCAEFVGNFIILVSGPTRR